MLVRYEGDGASELGLTRVMTAAETATMAATAPTANQLDRDAAGAVGGLDSPEAIHRSSLSRSCALCQRSSQSLARQLWTTRSSAGGDNDWSEETGGGSVLMMAEIKLAWLSPSNALRPVSIS